MSTTFREKNMKIKYNILDNEKGVLLTRTPDLCSATLTFEFNDVPAGATAIFEHSETGIRYFRKISNGGCELLLESFESGKLSLTVIILDGSADPQRWLCEELFIRKLDDRTFLIYPNDGDISSKVALIMTETSNLRKDIEKLKKDYSDLSNRLERIMEGYDLT